MELSLVEIPARLLCTPVLLLVPFARGRLRHSERERATSGDIYDRQRRNFQPLFRPIRTGVEEMAQAERPFATLGKK